MTAPLKKFFLEISGRSYEFCLETLTSEQYEYWSAREDELGEALTGFDDDEVPEEAILPNYYSDLDREGGPVVEDCFVTISDEGGNSVFSSALTDLPNYVATTSGEATDFEEDLNDGYYLKVEVGDKGSFFTAEFEAHEFDPKKLNFDTTCIEGVEIVQGFFYNEAELDDTGAWSCSGKYFEIDMIEVKGSLQRALNKSEELFLAGDITGAISVIEQALFHYTVGINKEFLKTQRQLAIYKMENGELDVSAALFKRNLANWEKLEGVYGKGYAVTAGYYAANLVEQGKYRRAIPLSERYLMSFNRAFHWYNLASALESVDRYQDAESAYLRALEVSTHKEDTRVKIGSLHGLFRVRKTDRKRHDKALEALNQAIEMARETKDAEALEILFAESEKPVRRKR